MKLSQFTMNGVPAVSYRSATTALEYPGKNRGITPELIDHSEARKAKVRAAIAANTLKLKISEVESLGWRVIAGGFSDSEEWQLENCVADLMGLSWAGEPVDFRIVRTDFLGTHVFRRSAELKEVE